MYLCRVPCKLLSLLVIAFCTFTTFAQADEGMWLFTNPPTAAIQKKYGFAITQEWLDHLRLSSSRAPGGSSEFVSPDGLLMTNHHVAQSCIHDLSSGGKDYMKDGFYAATREQEPKCPGIEFLVLTDIKDVSEQIHSAVKARMASAESGKATRQAMSAAEKACSTEGFKCDVVTLYAGAMYHLYKYKKYTDVRLVFAPEFQMAFFGGDPDNFTFPRYDLDITFFRMYENGKPAHTENYLKFAKKGVKEGDLLFVSGHPGRTSRLLSIAELEYLRDVQYPWQIKNLTRRVNLLLAFSKEGAEQAREAEHDLFSFQNSQKALTGYNTFFANKEGWAKKQADEKQFRDYVKAHAEREKEFGDPWTEVNQAEGTQRGMFFDYQYVEMLAGLRGSLAADARFIVRAAQQRTLPNDQRLRGYTDSALATREQELFSDAPAYKDLNKAMLADSLADMQEQEPKNPSLLKVLAGKSPKDRAAELIDGSKLDDAAYRKKLYDGGLKAVEESTDPLVVMMRSIEPQALALRQKFDDEVDPKLRDGGAKIAKVRFAIFGQTQPPDATFTLRLSYGPAKGYEENGKHIPWSTTMDGAYKHAADHGNKSPYELPKSWMDAKGKFDGNTPFDVVTTADIIGGNSGSPVVNTNGELVGIIFDGNIESLPLNFMYDDLQARAVHVDSRAILESLQKIYHADALYEEITGASGISAAKQ
ncbi:dipeptidyl-peptidase 7 [Candidatus Koribacter versatilis Ellin345]|uniref:Dipeptidyl-peptidase n=2 Tax=Candidatus Korobacter versatilis TaxID=658062 RepID=Q1IPC2_KORVE|nr:dipeptidyl-peptidase 7 [Candidatus Koribacter versatilis Ellin345]